ncbi:LOW QUALITY PROTEIN: serine/threonine-protein kinase Nek2 [Clarias gariepinus]
MKLSAPLAPGRMENARKSDGKILVWKELNYGTMAKVEKQMLVSEVNLLQELRHPNIVRYFDRIIDRTNATLYIVMEFCEGGDLATLITKCIKEKRYLEEEFVLRVMAQLSLALRECHSRNDGSSTVLHRDLKPANVFLDAKQNIKLGDFGLAQILKHNTSFAKNTPYYASPEQMNRMSYKEKLDIWSLGCLLYELCALSPPFTAYNQEELAESMRGRFRRILYCYSDVLNTLVCRMLHLKILVWKEVNYGTMTQVEKQFSEVNLLREFRHPNIVRYYDHIIDRTNTTLYIVMEFCEGGDLATLITKCIKEKNK